MLNTGTTDINPIFTHPGVITPCPGMVLTRTPSGWPVLHIHYTADPEKRSDAWKAAQRRKYTSDTWWQIEMEMRAHARSGQLVYPEFETTAHVIPDEEIPKRMCRYMSIDPHPRTPHAALWVGIDKWSDWYVYRELWPSKMYGRAAQMRDDEEDYAFTIREYAETFAHFEGNRINWRHPETDNEYGVYERSRQGERIITRLMDQASKGFKASAEGQPEEFYSSRYARFGISCSDPIKSHASGEDAIRSLLKPRRHEIRGNWPRLHIAASCIELQLELRRHRYKPTRRQSDDRELKQEGVEARSHLLDNLRYCATARFTYIERLVS